MISEDTTIEEMYRLGLISVRAMNVCRSGEISTLGQLLKMGRYGLHKIRNCGRKTIDEIEEIKTRYNNCASPVSECIEEIPIVEQENELIEANKKLELLSPNSVVHLKGWTAWKFSELSVRAKNAFPQFSQLPAIIEAIYSSEQFNALDAKNVGKKTSSEIQLFLNEVRVHFEEITKSIDITEDVPVYNEFDRAVAEIGDLYPFLLTKECEDIARHILSYNDTPILFIAKQYIIRSDDPRMNIYRDYYGFNSSGTRYSPSEVGERNNLSRERIRQLINKSISLPNSIEESIRQYLVPRLEDVIPFDSVIWNKIQHENLLEEPYSNTALLVSAVTDTHSIIQIADEDKEYLVKKELLENVKLRNVLTNIVRVIELRRTTVEQLDILHYIKEQNRLYHKDVSKLCTIYANYLKRHYEVEIEEGRYVMMLPNALDISIAVEDILAQSGSPMSLEGIKQEFNTLYPTNSIDDASKLKPYIFRNPNILAKGKTGIYVLKSWKNHFTGTLTSFLEHILHTFKEPIPLDDLVDFALDQFPKTNKKSIYSLIVADKDGRFVIYEDEYIGLSDNPISEIDLKERRIFKRYNFETRFGDLKQFVINRKRLPIQTGSEDERSLARWISNVLKANIDSTEEQLEILNNFLSENKYLPQNGTEYNFKQMCDEIKVLVTQSFALPTASENIREYNWLHKNIQKYTSYEDNRKLYFEDLLAYLKDFGFYL